MSWVHLVVRNVRTVCAVNGWKIVRKVTWIWWGFVSVKNWIAPILFNYMEKSVSKRWQGLYFWVNYSFNTFPHSFSFSSFLLCSLSNTFSDKPWKSPEIMRQSFLIHTQLPPSHSQNSLTFSIISPPFVALDSHTCWPHLPLWCSGLWHCAVQQPHSSTHLGADIQKAIFCISH